MIKPLQAVLYGNTSNPYARNSQLARSAYNNTINYAQKGEKLNINCADVRSVTRNGQKLDLYA